MMNASKTFFPELLPTDKEEKGRRGILPTHSSDPTPEKQHKKYIEEWRKEKERT
jgi:hypothetical protein